MNRRELQHSTDIKLLVSLYDVENQDPRLPDGYHLEKLRFYARRIVIRNHSLQDILNPEKALHGYIRGDSLRSLSEPKSVYTGAHRIAQSSCLPLSTYQDPTIRSNLLPRHGSQTVTAVLSSCSQLLPLAFAKNNITFSSSVDSILLLPDGQNECGSTLSHLVTPSYLGGRPCQIHQGHDQELMSLPQVFLLTSSRLTGKALEIEVGFFRISLLIQLFNFICL